MNVEKVIKGYFVFVLVVVGIAMFDDAQLASNYLASVLGGNELTAEVAGSELEEAWDKEATGLCDADEGAKMRIEMTLPAEENFSKAGREYKKVSDIKVKTFDEEVELRYMKLKVVGVNSLAIDKLTIVENDEVVAEAKRRGDYFAFSGLHYKFDPWSEGEISVRATLSDGLEPGDRFRFEIEESANLILKVDGGQYEMVGDFPIKGPYVTLINTKPIVKYIYNYETE